MFTDDSTAMHAWHLLTRLGEAEILLPVALLTAMMQMRRAPTRPGALLWLALLAAGIVFTTASKVAFIGWGIGWAELNFTGVSGHAMFAAAVYPLLLATLSSAAARPVRWLALLAGCALALLIGMSRVVVGAHSVSEVVAGLLLGGTVSLMTLAAARPLLQPIGLVAPLALAAWLAVMPVHAPASSTHSAVTRLSLRLSGHQRPYTRNDMLRQWRLRKEAARDAQPSASAGS